MTPKPLIIRDKDSEISFEKDRLVLTTTKKAYGSSITYRTYIENDGETLTIRSEVE